MPFTASRKKSTGAHAIAIRHSALQAATAWLPEIRQSQDALLFLAGRVLRNEKSKELLELIISSSYVATFNMHP